MRCSRWPALLLVILAGRLRGSVGVAWRYGVANLSRRRAESVVQIVAFGTGIMVLLLLAIIRGDLEQRLAAHAAGRICPIIFFINIPPAERDAFVAVPARRRAPGRPACCR